MQDHQEEEDAGGSAFDPAASVVSADLPKLLELNVELKRHCDEASSIVQSLAERVAAPDGDLSDTADKGNSLLELKNLLMVDYLSDLAYLVLRKTSGKSIAGDACVERLVAGRTVMEKIRPLEQKLKYQIGKAVKTADTGVVDGSDPLMFKAMPGNLVSKLGGGGDDDESSEDEEGGGGERAAKKGAGGKYVAPKNVPAFFDENEEDDGEGGSARRGGDRKQRLSRSLLDDLKRQHLDTPEEVLDREDVVRRRQLQAARERQRFEEDNFVRLPATKKAKAAMRRGNSGRMSTVANLGNEVTDFGRSFSEDGGGSGKKRGREHKGSSSFGKGAARKKFKRH